MSEIPWVDAAAGWTANRFSLSDTHEDVPAFLEKLAQRIRDLDEVTVLDICISRFFNGVDKFETRATVYFRKGPRSAIVDEN